MYILCESHSFARTAPAMNQKRWLSVQLRPLSKNTRGAIHLRVVRLSLPRDGSGGGCGGGGSGGTGGGVSRGGGRCVREWLKSCYVFRDRDGKGIMFVQMVQPLRSFGMRCIWGALDFYLRHRVCVIRIRETSTNQRCVLGVR